MKDAFGIEKAAHSHTRRILKEIASQGATSVYSRSKKRKVSKGRSRVSKIAMRPVFHGTTIRGATKLKRFIKAKDTSKSAFKYVVGKPRTDGTPGNAYDSRPEGLYTTRHRTMAEGYSLSGRSPDVGGVESFREKKGKVLVFNSVGVKPKFKTEGEEIYDPKELGAPLKTFNVNRRNSEAFKTWRKQRADDDHTYDKQIIAARKGVRRHKDKVKVGRKTGKKVFSTGPEATEIRDSVYGASIPDHEVGAGITAFKHPDHFPLGREYRSLRANVQLPGYHPTTQSMDRWASKQTSNEWRLSQRKKILSGKPLARDDYRRT
jgi:hypothetical protein